MNMNQEITTTTTTTPHIVCVDGNIGAGKSTLLDELETRGYVVHREGIEQWGKWLPKFYTGQKRWCFTLQTAILLDMRRQHDRILHEYADEDIIFVERCPRSALIFVDNSMRSGNLNVDEKQLYMDLHSRIGWSPDTTFILALDPETCLKRERQRDRDGEASITLEYLKSLENGYVQTPGVRLDARKNTNQIADEIIRSITGSIH